MEKERLPKEKPQIGPPASGRRAGIYRDAGEGFGEREEASVYPAPSGRMAARLQPPAGTERLIFAPMEGFPPPIEGGCILYGLRALSDRGPIKPKYLTGFPAGEAMVFPGGNPQLEFDLSGGPVQFIELSWDCCPIEGYPLHLLSRLGDALQERDALLEENRLLLQECGRYRQQCREALRQKEALQPPAARPRGLWHRLLSPLRRWMKANPHTAPLYQGLLVLRYEGLRAALGKAGARRNRKKGLQSFVRALLPSAGERGRQESYPFSRRVRFSIVAPLYNTPPAFLKQMIDSVRAQTYSEWELCLADGSDPQHPETGRICRRYAKRDPRIRYRKLEKNLGIAGNTNACLELATGSYIALFDHDDLLHPSALFECMCAIDEQAADFIYTDEMTFSGSIFHPITLHFKPDFAIDTLRANNYICHLSVFSRALLEAAGPLDSAMDGSQDYDLILRLTEKAKKIVHIQKLLYFWRSHPGSVASSISAKPYCIAAAKRALSAHLARCGLSGEVLDAPRLTSIYRIRYTLSGDPLVSIIIPNKNAPDVLERCLQSVYALSTYRHFEVIVAENGSTGGEIRALYRQLQAKHENLRILYYTESGFNFSSVNNFAAKQAKGEYLLFLNNDTEVISPEWIEELLMFAQRPDVGAVGAKLLYPDGSVQHAGVVVGLRGTAGHIHYRAGAKSLGYMGRLCYAQNFSAVTAACMMMRRTLFEELHGFDEQFAVAYNDIDLCLRLREKGKLIVFTPFAELFHHESLTRGDDLDACNEPRFRREEALFMRRWREAIEKGDPYFNRNFRLDRADFAVRDPE